MPSVTVVVPFMFFTAAPSADIRKLMTPPVIYTANPLWLPVPLYFLIISPLADVLNHPSIVVFEVICKLAPFLQLTESPDPSKLSARSGDLLPATHVALVIVPWLPLPDKSGTLEVSYSCRIHSPTNPFERRFGRRIALAAPEVTINYLVLLLILYRITATSTAAPAVPVTAAGQFLLCKSLVLLTVIIGFVTELSVVTCTVLFGDVPLV